MPNQLNPPRRDLQYEVLNSHGIFLFEGIDVESIHPSPAHGRLDRVRTLIGCHSEFSATV